MVIDVLGVRFTVRAAEIGELPQDTPGCCNVSKGLILYDPTQCPEEMRETILHEIFHALDIKTAGGEELKEPDISRMSALLFAFLTTNLQFSLWLITGVKDVTNEH